ncbi:MAG TPA: ATP-binding protein [Chloroflexota bacterium]|nr:ATP-binding protein [Chloroflexota bacterium]
MHAAVSTDRLEGRAEARLGVERAFGLFLAFFFATFLLWVVVKPIEQHGLVVLSDLVLPTVAIFAGVTTVMLALRMQGRERRSWLLIGLGTLSWGLGMAVWSYYELVLEAKTPFPSLADLGYLGMIPLMFAGLVSLPASERPAEGRIKAVLDAVIVMTGIATVSWFAVLGPVYSQADKTWLETLIGLAYPAGDVLLMCALVGGMARGWIARRDPALIPLVLGIVLFSISDSAFAYLTMNDLYESGNPIDVGWSTGFLLVAYAAVRRWAQGSAAPGRALLARPWLVATQRAAPYVLVLAVTALVFVTQVYEQTSTQNIFLALALFTVILVVARQFVTLRENERLNDELRGFSQRLEALVEERTTRLAVLHRVAAALSAAASPEAVCRAGLRALLDVEGGQAAALYLRRADAFEPVATESTGADPVLCPAVPDAVAGIGGEEIVSLPGAEPGRGSIWIPVSERGEVFGVIAVFGADVRESPDTQMLATIGAEFGVAYQNQRRIEEANRQELARVQSAAQTEKLRALGQMAGGVAHDLNQSLAMVMGYTDFARLCLGQMPPDLEKLGRMLDVVTQAATTGGETVKRLLAFARPRQETPPEPTDVDTVLREAAQLTAPRWRDAAQAEGRQISLHVESEPGLVVDGWPAALRDALTNLVFNAVDALPQGGTIGLRARSRGGSVEIEVADSGTGMTAEVQAKIFEPFFTTKGDRGTGLGLAQVFSTVERHSGRIAVRSAPGKGTTFHITLPPAEPGVSFRPVLPDAVAATGHGAEAAAAAVADDRCLRVLAVDDEPLLRELAAEMLRRQGHAVVTAESGEEALERLAQEPFDLVVSDVGLGAGINGWELVGQVRARFPAVRLALATGWGGQIDPAEARARGVERVIAKPYRMADLQRLVEALPRT